MKPRIRAVAFDLFGTLVEITDKHYPYARIVASLKLSAAERIEARRRLMTEPIGLACVAPAFGRELDPELLAAAEHDLYRELASVRLYPDAADTLQRLRADGLRIAIASNLALPYAVAARLFLPLELDAYAWSFEVGSIKPDAAFYSELCHRLDCPAEDILMVGDTYANDYLGATAAGLRALHLARSGPSGPNVVLSLDGVMA